tara:strand:- start:417 stop:557 length:141 start_codon:yes stop_codon:yes gene_type:complete
MSLRKCTKYETKSIRLSLHLLKKTNFVGLRALKTHRAWVKAPRKEA